MSNKIRSSIAKLSDPLEVEKQIIPGAQQPIEIKNSIRSLVQTTEISIIGISDITIYPTGQVNAPFKWKVED